MPKGFITKAKELVVSSLGYHTIQKDHDYKSIALNADAHANSLMRIKQQGLSKPSNISFKLLRQLSRRDAVVRICINVIKKSVSQADWSVLVKKNSPKETGYYEKIRLETIDFFEHMNANGENMRILLDRVLEDLLTLDAGVIEKVTTLNGTQLVALNSVDGATIKPVYNEFGELGDPIAYKQVIGNKVVAEFRQDEIIYMMANPQNDIDLFGYGQSPIESILLQVQASLEADIYNMKSFSVDNVPPGMLDLGDMDDNEAKKFIALWNAIVLANPQAMKFVWGGENPKKYTPFNQTNKDMQFSEYIDWLSRVKLSSFGLSSIDANMLQDVNRATAESQREITNSRGVASTKRLIEEYFTRQIIRPMSEDHKWLEFKFEDASEIWSKKTQTDIDAIDVKMGIRTINEVRGQRGLEPIEEKDQQDFTDVEDFTIDDPTKISEKKFSKSFY